MGLICNTCLEPPIDPVVTSCGHLFCWPCLYRWILNEPRPCPVCRNVLRRNINVVPIYDNADGSEGSATEAAGATSDGTFIPSRPDPPASAPTVAAASILHDSAFRALQESYDNVRIELLADLEYERARVTTLQLNRNDMEVELMTLRRARSELQKNEAELVTSNVTFLRELNTARESLAETRQRLEVVRHSLAAVLRLREDVAQLRRSAE